MALIREKTMREHKQNQEQIAKENEKLIKKKEKQITFNNNIIQKRFVEETWKIKYQNYLLETLEDDNLDVAIELGIKLFELIADFKVRIIRENVSVILIAESDPTGDDDYRRAMLTPCVAKRAAEEN